MSWLQSQHRAWLTSTVAGDTPWHVSIPIKHGARAGCVVCVGLAWGSVLGRQLRGQGQPVPVTQWFPAPWCSWMEGGMTFPGCGCAGGLRAARTPLIPDQLCFLLPSVATSQSPLGNGSWQELAHAVPWHQPQGSSGDSSSSVAMGD